MYLIPRSYFSTICLSLLPIFLSRQHYFSFSVTLVSLLHHYTYLLSRVFFLSISFLINPHFQGFFFLSCRYPYFFDTHLPYILNSFRSSNRLSLSLNLYLFILQRHRRQHSSPFPHGSNITTSLPLATLSLPLLHIIYSTSSFI